ncbi:MAG: hypothetical protein JWP89_3868 [Schlesneria sp.]|nr:hypothetical protein [Schlesneria sp.]
MRLNKHLFIKTFFALASGCGAAQENSEYHAVAKIVVTRSDTTTSTEDQTTESLSETQTLMSVPAEALSELPASALALANPRQIELLVPTKTWSMDRQTDAIRLTFEDFNLLSVLNMDPVTEDAISYMPEWLRSLDGKRVRLRGYMYLTYEPEVERFALLRDNLECCFGPGAKIYDNLMVDMKAGTKAKYVNMKESLEVVGRFRIDLKAERGYIYGLYRIEDATVFKR